MVVHKLSGYDNSAENPFIVTRGDGFDKIVSVDFNQNYVISPCFSGQSKISEILLGKALNSDMKNMFKGCFNLQSLDLSGADMERVTNTDDMFEGCTSLTALNISKIPSGSSIVLNFEDCPLSEDSLLKFANVNSGHGRIVLSESVLSMDIYPTVYDSLTAKGFSVSPEPARIDINSVATGWLAAKGGYKDKNFAIFLDNYTVKSLYAINTFQSGLTVLDTSNYTVEDDGENFIFKGIGEYTGEKVIPYVRTTDNGVKEISFFIYSGSGIFNSGSSVACQQYDYLMPEENGVRKDVYAKWDKWSCSVESATTSVEARCGMNMNTHDDDFQTNTGASKIAMQTYYDYSEETLLTTGGTNLNQKKWISPHFANSSTTKLPKGTLVTIENFRLYYKEDVPSSTIEVTDDNSITTSLDDATNFAYIDENENKLTGYADIY